MERAKINKKKYEGTNQALLKNDRTELEAVSSVFAEESARREK